VASIVEEAAQLRRQENPSGSKSERKERGCMGWGDREVGGSGE
jgi:hypothetical protein